MTGISDSPELTDKASSAASKIDGVARRCGESTNRYSRHSHTDCMYWHIMRPLSLDPFLQKKTTKKNKKEILEYEEILQRFGYVSFKKKKIHQERQKEILTHASHVTRR